MTTPVLICIGGAVWFLLYLYAVIRIPPAKTPVRDSGGYYRGTQEYEPDDQFFRVTRKFLASLLVALCVFILHLAYQIVTGTFNPR